MLPCQPTKESACSVFKQHRTSSGAVKVKCVLRPKGDKSFWSWQWASLHDGGDGLTVPTTATPRASIAGLPDQASSSTIPSPRLSMQQAGGSRGSLTKSTGSSQGGAYPKRPPSVGSRKPGGGGPPTPRGGGGGGAASAAARKSVAAGRGPASKASPRSTSQQLGACRPADGAGAVPVATGGRAVQAAPDLSRSNQSASDCDRDGLSLLGDGAADSRGSGALEAPPQTLRMALSSDKRDSPLAPQSTGHLTYCGEPAG
eukprot:TRINITY_DN19698_c0_g1_i1.p1 TRINITY_DN19698_c0_g1~~TRINITY_DN19698_c0_g1_i1.p1  ORF type:complete len:258 (-),score=40.01 TRINITY_DN19698_c0_g1_i1:157-930(-)